MSGAGNDFVVIDNRSKKIRNGSRAARRLCDRRWGVGADGLLLLEKSHKADYRMMYFNADGSYGGMCGNGGRCIARYALLNGIAGRKHRFEALKHVYAAAVTGSQVVLTMKDPRRLTMKKKTRLTKPTKRLVAMSRHLPVVRKMSRLIRTRNWKPATPRTIPRQRSLV